MIKDNLNNAEKYYNLSPLIKKGLQFLQQNNLTDFKSGKFEIDGDDIYMNVQEYETKISNKVESHRKYIDIQYMIQGEEIMGVAKSDTLQQITEYDTDKDVIFYNGDTDKVLVKQNEFVIFYPEDAHLPCQMNKSAQNVKKTVVKIKIRN